MNSVFVENIFFRLKSNEFGPILWGSKKEGTGDGYALGVFFVADARNHNSRFGEIVFLEVQDVEVVCRKHTAQIYNIPQKIFISLGFLCRYF